MEEQEKKQKPEFKGNLGFIWLVGLLVILLGCTIVYVCKLKKEVKDLKQVPITSESQQQATEGDEKVSSSEEKYSDNLTDEKNGKLAFIELESKGELQTEKHSGYYTYIDPFEKEYNIKEIKEVVSEKGIMGTDNWAALFKVIVTYIDNNDNTKTMKLAIILEPNHEVQCGGTYDNFTGSTSFVKNFTNLYGKTEETDDKNKSDNTKNIIGTYKAESETKNYYYSSELIISKQTSNSIKFSISAVHGKDINHVNVGEVSGTAKKINVPKELAAPDSIQYAYQFKDNVDNKTNKITIVYTHFKMFETIDVIEEYANDINPYGGAGVYFRGDYEKIN